jgi:hypothetical protein
VTPKPKPVRLTPNTYEIYPDGRRDRALESVLGDAQAASHLGIPFRIETITYEAFRHGSNVGNVEKATVKAYRISFGEETETDD